MLLLSPYENGNVGFSIELPESAVVVGTTTNPPSCLINSGNSSNAWHLRIDRGPNPETLTPKELVYEIKNRREDPAGTRVLQDQSVLLGDKVGWLLFIEQSGEESSSLFGWLAIPAPGAQYLLASILTTDVGWAAHGDQITQLLRSLRILDPIELISRRLRGLDAASITLQSFNEEVLEPLTQFKEWRRFQLVKGEGIDPIDIGYAYVVVWKGTAQAIEAFTDPSYEHGEPTGIVVTLKTRLVPNPERGTVIDSQARYWMSFDGHEERWKNQIKRWLDQSFVFESETGIRTQPHIGQPKATLKVFQENLTASTIETPFETAVIDPWLPRALHWVMGPILANAKEEPLFIWNAYENSFKEKVVTRTDKIQQLQGGGFELETTFGDSNEVIQSTFDGDGYLLKQIQSGGIIVTGSNEETLRAIWQPRNLW